MATAATWHDTIPTNQIKPETSDFGTIKTFCNIKRLPYFFRSMDINSFFLISCKKHTKEIIIRVFFDFII